MKTAGSALQEKSGSYPPIMDWKESFLGPSSLLFSTGA